MYSSLILLYASYVMDGMWEIENIAPVFKTQVEELIAERAKKKEIGE